LEGSRRAVQVTGGRPAVWVFCLAHTLLSVPSCLARIRHGLGSNVTQLRRRGHFSRCPEEYRHYCVKGRCRFLVAEAAPACVCEPGYMGARCELVDIFPLRGDRGQIVVISLIAGIIVLIIFVVCTCFCVQYQRRKRKEEEMETLSKNLPSKSEDVLETDVA
uniref:Probetacellulin n=1 Tax=Anas zonorhyncha TaxID=75864 RepID=A0A8B9VGY6_9AVES